ncbi:MAG TPA: hypothetical protein VMD77_04320 [Candidatus Baltobacteraceae bacterium]|jgi:uncharacterized membrane protein YeaQ/YmgE (transglycosylase-associated protein family)|nr:hypothetical protein [Candidatus Baltobacteraceae bacterium]
MIGMNFGAFLTLLILGLIATIVMHFVIRYRMMDSTDGFFAKWIAAWIGGWLGGPVLGHWWFRIQNVYIIPALVGAFVGAFALVVLLKAPVVSANKVLAAKVTSSASPEVMRKVS